MQTSTREIADRIYRLSTLVPDAAPGGFTLNQFLVDADDLCYSIQARAACFRSCRRRSPAFFLSSGSGGSRSATSNPTSAGR